MNGRIRPAHALPVSAAPFGAAPCLAAALLPLTLLLACGGGSGASSSSSAPAPSGPQGQVAVAVTDAPSDQWSHFVVRITRVELKNSQNAAASAVVFDGAAQPALIDLVKLDSVAELLGKAQVPAGTYDKVEITVDTNPADILLIDTGNPPAQVPSGKIQVVGGPLLSLSLAHPLVVSDGGSSVLQVEFDLSHPLFSVVTTDGHVVISFQLKQKDDGGDPTSVQLKDARGRISAVDAAGFSLQTAEGRSFAFKVDAGTEYLDGDAHAAGSLGGLNTNKYAVVFAQIQPDGSLLAKRVIYTLVSAALPNFTTDGHVVHVANGVVVNGITHYGFELHDAQGHPTNFNVDANTRFFFRGEGTDLGTGTAALANLQRGFNVHVEVVDPTAVPLQARRVNITRAMDEGRFINADTHLYLDQTLSTRQLGPASYGLGAGFTWWFYEHADQPQDLPALQALLGSNPAAAELKMSGAVELGWSGHWEAKNAVLVPVHLKGALAGPYDAAAHTLAFSYVKADTTSAEATLTLVPSGPDATKVMRIQATPNGVTASLVDPSQWAAVLVPGSAHAEAAVIPQADGSLKVIGIALAQ